MSISCQKCGNSNVQCLSHVYRANTQNTYHFGAVPGLGFGTAYSQGASELARMVAPPPKPRWGLGHLFLTALLAVPSVFMIFCSINNPAATSGWFEQGLLLSMVPVLFVVLSILRVKAKRPAWERAMATWWRLVYCERCGNITLPPDSSTETETFLVRC